MPAFAGLGEGYYTTLPTVYLQGQGSTLYANELAGTNCLRIVVCGNEERTTVTALFDNLGKGASGAAVKNMNIVLGLDEATGLL